MRRNRTAETGAAESSGFHSLERSYGFYHLDRIEDLIVSKTSRWSAECSELRQLFRTVWVLSFPLSWSKLHNPALIQTTPFKERLFIPLMKRTFDDSSGVFAKLRHRGTEELRYREGTSVDLRKRQALACGLIDDGQHTDPTTIRTKWNPRRDTCTSSTKKAAAGKKATAPKKAVKKSPAKQRANGEPVNLAEARHSS